MTIKTIPALRHSYANGILRALESRGAISIRDLIASTPNEELFKGSTVNVEQRAQALLSYARELGLVDHAGGKFELTERGRQYVSAGDSESVWTVTDDQARVLRDLMVDKAAERGGIFHGAAIGLSLFDGANGVTPSAEEFGRALGMVTGMDSWHEPHTFVSQGRAYLALLEAMQLVDDDSHITAIGTELLDQVIVPAHPPLKDLIEAFKPAAPRAASVWLVRAGVRGQAEALNFTEGVVSIGWTELPDVGAISTQEQMREFYAESYPEAPPGNVGQQSQQVFLFAHEIQPGDLVLTPLKTRPGYVAVAKVIGPYQYRGEAPFVPEGQHTHAAEWLSTGLSVESLDPSLRTKLGLRRTVNKLDVAGAVQLVMDALARESEGAIHLIVKWAARYGPDTVERHVEVANATGSVWWGLAAPGGDGEPRLDRKWFDQLRSQLAGGISTNVFLSGPSCWRTTLRSVSYTRDEVDEDRIPSYYASVSHQYHLWVELAHFEPIDRDELYQLLDPVAKPGRPIALSNQTNPLLVRYRGAPRTWWVNQGRTYERARAGRYLWAPLLNRTGGTQEHWLTMGHLRAGDVVLNYSATEIRALSTVLGESKPAARPDPEADQAWSNEGLRAELDWRDLDEPIALNDIPVEWRTSERGPFDKTGAVNQGYLFPVSDEFAQKLASRFPQLAELAGLPHPVIIENKDEPSLATIWAALHDAGLTIDERTLRRYHLSLKTRGFVVLSGISGTGKTWLAEEYAKAVNARPLVVPVAPNWTTNEDLLGYLNPLSQTYHDTEFSTFLREAADEYADATRAGRTARPFHLILDEMNLARVEFYFAKFLSAMELRTRSEDAFIELAPNRRVALTPNLKFVGTVNVDETTHGFADKVYDRSQLLELTITRDAVVQHLGDRPFAPFLADVWSVMREVAPFAFRVLDEISAYVTEAEALGVSWEEALDEQLLQKVLPKVKGTDRRVGGALRDFIDLTADRFPLSYEKAQTMFRTFEEHGFTSYF